MDFKENQAIYLQIADLICENILAGAWKSGERVPSVRELAETTEVNPNTVMRTYAYLQDQGIIENQRGIGYFVSARAFEITMELKKKSFVSRDLPRVFRTMDLLRMSFDDLKALHFATRANDEKEKMA